MPFEHCEHVYRNMNQNPCPKCGGDTHETDFKIQAELRKKYYEEGNHLDYICNDCGGSLRKWWSI